jgi:hypothetical protein
MPRSFRTWYKIVKPDSIGSIEIRCDDGECFIALSSNVDETDYNGPQCHEERKEESDLQRKADWSIDRVG